MLNRKLASLAIVAGTLGLSQGALAQSETAFGPDPWYVANDRVADPKPSNDGGIARPFGADVWYVLGDTEANPAPEQTAADRRSVREILDEAFNRHAPAA